jgi:hypothetical protein
MKSLEFRGAWLTPLLTRAALLTVTMLLGLLLAAGAALADTVIDTTPQANGQDVTQPFGSPNTATYGQLITAPFDDTQLDSFTFFISMSGTVVVRGEVYAWDGQKATGPNLYESAPRTISNTSGFQEVTFDTGGVQLVPGQRYVLFATITKDYASSNGSGTWEAVFSDPYPGGNFVYMNNGSSFDQLFTEAWGQFPTFDSAFRAVFSASASASPPELDIQSAKLGTGGTAEISGTIQCTEGQQYNVFVTVRQTTGNRPFNAGGSSYPVFGSATCTGETEPFTVTVVGEKPFKKGTALVEASAQVCDPFGNGCSSILLPFEEVRLR